ncbi:MAG: DUF692 family protein [Planctomycetaceae bacterium]
MKHERIETGLSLMLEEQFHDAVQPLLDAGEVDILEWSFDMAWNGSLPFRVETLLHEFSTTGHLLGHGVSFSPLSGHWSERQDAWLRMLQDTLQRTPMRHISEHFGFMEAGNFHQAPPLPVPRTEETLAVGRDRLQRLADVSRLPVGLENLAFAFSLSDVRQQGQFLEELLEPVQGFLVLDLHNIYCQSCNFGVCAGELIGSYPLNRVRELHVSGGSWSDVIADGNTRTLRRDTHDGPVPNEIFPLVESVLSRCPNLEAVILEHLGTALDCPGDADQLRADYRQLRQIVSRHRDQM